MLYEFNLSAFAFLLSSDEYLELLPKLLLQLERLRYDLGIGLSDPEATRSRKVCSRPRDGSTRIPRLGEPADPGNFFE